MSTAVLSITAKAKKKEKEKKEKEEDKMEVVSVWKQNPSFYDSQPHRDHFLFFDFFLRQTKSSFLCSCFQPSLSKNPVAPVPNSALLNLNSLLRNGPCNW